VKFGREEQVRSSLPNFTLIGTTTWGEKPKNQSVSKNTTCRAALWTVYLKNSVKVKIKI